MEGNAKDTVETGGYTAGQDPVLVAGGPIAPTKGQVVQPLVIGKKGVGPARSITVEGPALFQGQTGVASVNLAATGNENGVGLSLTFDPTLVQYVSTVLGSGIATNITATMDVNATHATNGQVGVILALPTNVAFTPGLHEILKVSFQAVTTNSLNSALTLANTPVRLEISDTNANPVTATYSNGVIALNPKPSLAIAQSGQALTLSWPYWGTNYVLQQASGPSLVTATWTNVTLNPVLGSNVLNVTVPPAGTAEFFRLQHK